jgi:amino-acid N-acetyltransferase
VQDRIRRATVDDQVAITRLVHQARLNPRGLDWRRFVIAQAGDAPIGVAQVRRHPDGSRELASLVVLSEHRDRGVAGRMIDALLTDEPGQVFTLVDRRYARHFIRWNLQPVDPVDLPRSMARQLLIGRVATAIGSLLLRHRIRLLPLRRPPPGPQRLTTPPSRPPAPAASHAGRGMSGWCRHRSSTASSGPARCVSMEAVCGPYGSVPMVAAFSSGIRLGAPLRTGRYRATGVRPASRRGPAAGVRHARSAGRGGRTSPLPAVR